MTNDTTTAQFPDMSYIHRHHRVRGILAGLTVCALGGLLLLRAMNIIPADMPLVDFWPLVLVYFGLSALVSAHGLAGRLVGTGLGAIGTLLLLEKMHLTTIGTQMIWPVAVVLFGVAIVVRAMRPRRSHQLIEQRVHAAFHQADWRRGATGSNPRYAYTNEVSSENELTRTIFLSGGEIRSEAKAFTGGSLQVTAGGLQIDLRDVVLANNRAELHVSATMAGIEIIVPPHWRIKAEVAPTLGGFDDSTRPSPAADAEGECILTIRGQVFLGGVNVRN